MDRIIAYSSSTGARVTREPIWPMTREIVWAP